MSEAQAGNRTYPKWQKARLSHNQDSSVHYFSTLGLLPAKEGMGMRGPTPCPDRAENRRAVHVHKHHIMYGRSAMQPSPTGPLPTRVCAAQTLHQGWVKPWTLPTLLVLSPHVAAAKHWPPEEHWISATVWYSAPDLLQTLKCGKKDKAEPHQKGKVIKKHPQTGLGLWSLICASGGWHD